jgi:anti-sigma-K factor RskA
MPSEHEHWREQSEIYALRALDGRESDQFETHLSADCAICKAHLRETRELLNLLHRSLQPITPPAPVKNRVLQRIEAEKAIPISAARPKTNRRWPRVTGMIAAGLIGVVVTAAYYDYSYRSRLNLYAAVIDLLRDPATRDLPLYGAGPAPSARGRFLWNESGEGHIFAAGLPPAPEGKMYAVWTIAQNSAPRYAGAINTDAKGQGGLHINDARSDKPVAVFAVTLEPIGATTAPTGPMVLVSKTS